MKMLFKQKLFSWFQSYDIYDENGNTIYTVKGVPDIGHCFYVLDKDGNRVGMIEQEMLTFLPKYSVYEGAKLKGTVKKELSFFKPKFTIDFNNWVVDGDFMQWDYEIRNADNEVIAIISKELFNLTDTYVIDVKDENDALDALALVVVIDAIK